MECRAGDYSGLMPANFTTFAHFLVSSARSLPYSVGESASGVLPRSAIRALILGSVRPALISRLSLSIISAAVFLGATRPVWMHTAVQRPPAPAGVALRFH